MGDKMNENWMALLVAILSSRMITPEQAFIRLKVGYKPCKKEEQK
jgi:hypothetical protein